jgi:AraC-like DNA-binding protein
LPPSERYRAWLRREWPRQRQIYRTEPTEPFNTRWEAAQLGLVTFVHVEISAMRWERRREDIRSSDFDPIIVSMMIEGEARGSFDGRPFHEPAGTIHFHDLARPSLHTSTASRTYGVIVPRPVAQEWFGPVGELHGLVADQRQAEMLISHAAQVREALARLGPNAAAGLGQSLLTLIAILADELRPVERAGVTPLAALRERAVEEIERRLSTAGASVGQIAQALKVSRAKLFSAFQADGGVHAYIMDQRLGRARTAVADVERAEPIGDIAHRLGFSDSSHFSRLFKGRFGMTPSEYRRRAAADVPGKAGRR